MRALLLFLAAWLGLAPLRAEQDVAVTAIAALTDPAKLATLTAKRAANPRFLKCVYWLHDARTRGLEPKTVVAQAQAITHSEGARATLILAALIRSLDIAEKLGCLEGDNADLLRRGRSPTITHGPYAGDPAEVDHIIPIAVVAHLENEIANLELLPRTINRRLGMKITQRELSYAGKFRDAGLLTEEEFQLIQSRYAPAKAGLEMLVP